MLNTPANQADTTGSRCGLDVNFFQLLFSLLGSLMKMEAKITINIQFITFFQVNDKFNVFFLK